MAFNFPNYQCSLMCALGTTDVISFILYCKIKFNSIFFAQQTSICLHECKSQEVINQ